MNRNLIALAAAILMTLATTFILLAQEEPADEPITPENLAAAAEAYFGEQADGGGMIEMMDPQQGYNIYVSFDQVHQGPLHQTGENQYFVCVDMAAPTGEVYDFDVFFQGTSATNLQVTQVLIHKQDDVARYGWQEQDGLYVQVPVE